VNCFIEHAIDYEEDYEVLHDELADHIGDSVPVKGEAQDETEDLVVRKNFSESWIFEDILGYFVICSFIQSMLSSKNF
jgi:hypothetical protein